MPDSNVSSCVLNILGSFSSSLGLYKKLREKRKRKKTRFKKNEPFDEQELRLSRSLQQGPEDISREYQRSIFAVGDQFAIGDAIAQTSLAEILLRLNVGLIGIITSFLHNDKNDVQLDYRGLADLSDRSRLDTCRALRQLYKRLTHLRHPLAITSKEVVEAGRGQNATNDSSVDGSKGTKGMANRTKIRGRTLAHITIQDSSKPPQIMLVRPAERRKKSHSSSGSGSSLSKAQSDTKSASQASTPPPEYTAYQPRRQTAERANTASDVRKPNRKHSAANITGKSSAKNGESLRATRSTPRLHSTLQEPIEPLPPMPNTAPLPTASTPDLIVPRRRKPTPTFYSIATDSTKLGEIPLHKWACQPDFDQMSVLNREAYRNGWPNDPATLQVRRKRTGLLGLFGRRSL